MILLLALTPLFRLALALLNALVLFWPVMWCMGALHTYVPMVPSLGWVACFWLVALLSLLLPSSVNLGD